MSDMGGREFLHGIKLWVFTHFWRNTAAAEPSGLYLRLIDKRLPSEGIVLIQIFKTQ